MRIAFVHSFYYGPDLMVALCEQAIWKAPAQLLLRRGARRA